jgi:tryptophanyl-tRNA synthetase
MSASEPETAIFTTDPPEIVKRKIWKAFTGGKGPIAEQKKLGAEPDVCTIFQYFFYLFEEDDKKLAEREKRCKAGEIICGECKKDLTERVNRFLGEHQKKREKAKDTIAKFHIKR